MVNVVGTLFFAINFSLLQVFFICNIKLTVFLVCILKFYLNCYHLDCIKLFDLKKLIEN